MRLKDVDHPTVISAGRRRPDGECCLTGVSERRRFTMPVTTPTMELEVLWKEWVRVEL